MGGIKVAGRSAANDAGSAGIAAAGVAGHRHAFEAGETRDAICALSGQRVCGSVGGIGIATSPGSVAVRTEFALVAVFYCRGGEGGEGSGARIRGAPVRWWFSMLRERLSFAREQRTA